MGALLYPQDIHISQADILNGSIVLSAKEDAGFRSEVNVVHDHAADFSGNPVASAPFGGRKENRLTLAPPSGRALAGNHTVRIASGVSRHMMDGDVRNGSSVPGPDTHAAGTVPHHAVAQDDIADISPSFRSDF